MSTIKYLMVLCFLGCGSTLAGQCFCQPNIVAISDCCGELELSFGANCDSMASSFNQLVIDPTVFPSFSGRVSGFTPYIAGLSASIDPVSGVATISYSGNLLGLVSPGGTGTLGEICFEEAIGGVVTSSIVVSGPGPDICEGFAEVPLNCPPAGYWDRICGDTLDNRPNRIRAFTDGVYVAGYVVEAGEVYPTMSKYSIADGSLEWQRRLLFPGRINDFAYDAANDELILVGAYGQVAAGEGEAASGNSFILKLDDLGNPGLSKLFDLTGREGFTRIIKHPHPLPANANFPYYVLGRKNPAGAPLPSTEDVTVLYNMDEDLNVNWVRDYQANVEIEAYRGLIPLTNGGLFIVGNGSSFGPTSNEGILLDVNSVTGALIQATYYPGVIDLYHGVDLDNGEVALVGTDFGNNQALVYMIDRSTYQVTAGLRFPDVSTFREVGIDADGFLYAVGRKTGAGPNYHVVHKLSYINGIAGLVLSDVYYRYLYDNETAFDEPHLYVSPAHDAIFYADARRDNPSGFGNFDLFIGSFDLDLSSDCRSDFPQQEQTYSISQQNFLCAVSPQPELSNGLQYVLGPPNYQCNAFCSVPACTADFTWTANCLLATFTGQATGTGPFTYDWDFGCDNPQAPDASGANVTWVFPASGTYQVCLTVTDATGCSATVQQAVTVVDNPPTLTCPPDLNLPTDPGLCTATTSLPMATPTDDCTTNFTISCTMSGATTGTVTDPVTLNKGVTTITCRTEDSSGQLADCTYTVTVVDQEAPTIDCPDPIFTSAPACEGGAIVDFDPATFTDNCPMAVLSSSHQSGDFFPCGATIVTYTVTDMAGNTTNCTFPITVDCQCVEFGNETINCTAVDDQFAFSVDLIDLTGAGAGACNATVTSSQPGVTISGVTVSGGGPAYTVSGLIDITGPPVPTTINLTVTVSCVCPNGAPYPCSFPLGLQTPCCKEIGILPEEVCRLDGTVQIPLQGCGSLYDVRQVRWYVADAPCPPGSWGPPFQVTNGCAPLNLSPPYHTGDICVYAEVLMGPGAGPCTMLTTNVATIQLCDPIGCGISSDQAYCYTGSPITPTPLTVGPLPAGPACTYTFQWYDANGPIPGETGTTYQPPALVFTANPTDCSQTYTYSVVVSSVCGDQTCSVSIRLDNEAAPDGSLVLLPPDTQPLCYGDDAVLEYTPACAGSPERWTWHESLDGTGYTPLTTNGDRNPIFYTNRLYQDTWYRVEKRNGVCPVDQVDLFLDVLDPLTINNFTATASPVCAPTQVDLQVDFAPSFGLGGPCDYTIYWYRNGTLLHTSVHHGSPASHTYLPPMGTDVGGNYYVVIESNCCADRGKSTVVSLDPPMEVLAAGPCFRCQCEDVTLEGIVLNPLAGFNCTYQWYHNGVALAGETSSTLMVDPGWIGTFTFEVTCSNGSTTCVQSADFALLQCGFCISAVEELPLLTARVFPNPTNGRLRLELLEDHALEVMELLDMQGRLLRRLPLPGAQRTYELDLEGLPDGVYVLRGIADDGRLLLVNIVKQ